MKENEIIKIATVFYEGKAEQEPEIIAFIPQLLSIISKLYELSNFEEKTNNFLFSWSKEEESEQLNKLIKCLIAFFTELSKKYPENKPDFKYSNRYLNILLVQSKIITPGLNEKIYQLNKISNSFPKIPISLDFKNIIPNNELFNFGTKINETYLKPAEIKSYTAEEVKLFRQCNDNRLYKTLADVSSENPKIWENGRYGYFTQYEPNFLHIEKILNKIDDLGLRFYQIDIDGKAVVNQSKQILITGFGKYLLINWGNDLSDLMDKYVNDKYKKFAIQWRNDNFPNNKMGTNETIQFFNQLKINEKVKLEQITIKNYFSKIDNEKLEQALVAFMKSLDLRIEYAQSKMNMNNNLIQLVRTGRYSQNWVNAKPGGFRFYSNDCTYKFIEMTDGLMTFVNYGEEDAKGLISAVGFTAYLINRFGEETHKIFDEYLHLKLNQYKNKHNNAPDAHKRDLEKEFLSNYPIQEEEWIKQSETIFEYITDKEVEALKEYIQNYREYVVEKCDPLYIVEYTKQSEIIIDNDWRIKLAYEIFLKYPEKIEIFNLISRVNDVRKILKYYVEKPDECLDYIMKKYQTIWNISTVFIECLKYLIDDSTVFMILLNNQRLSLHKITQEDIKKIVDEFNTKNKNDLFEINSSKSKKELLFDYQPTSSNINPTQITRLKENYEFWKEKEANIIETTCNIFDGYDFDKFIEMIQKHDFSPIFVQGNKDRVRYNIYIISRYLGEEWGQRSAEKLKCNFKDLTKNVKFVEYEELKKMYKTPLP